MTRPVRTALCILLAGAAVLSAPAAAQELTIDLGEGATVSGRVVQLFLLVTVLSLAPGLAVMVTCFPFIVTVLAILRQAIGLQQSPPNMLIVSLALFLTWFVMDPVFTEAWVRGIEPLTRNAATVEQAIPAVIAPFRGFMTARLDPDTFAAMAALRPGPPPTIAEAPLSVEIASVPSAFRSGAPSNWAFAETSIDLIDSPRSGSVTERRRSAFTVSSGSPRFGNVAFATWIASASRRMSRSFWKSSRAF